MPKLKTKSSAKKRFKTTASGKIRGCYAFKRHNLRKRPQKMKRKTRGTRIFGDSDSRSCLRLEKRSIGVGMITILRKIL